MTQEGKTHPATQVIFQGRWCAGHRWRSRNRVAWWVHHLGHRARILRNQPPRYNLVFIEGKPPDAVE